MQIQIIYNGKLQRLTSNLMTILHIEQPRSEIYLKWDQNCLQVVVGTQSEDYIVTIDKTFDEAKLTEFSLACLSSKGV